MFEPVKIALGEYMVRWFKTLVPTTLQMQEYVRRPPELAIAIAPGRMIDAAEEMFLKYLRKDITGQTTQPYKLPMVLLAIGREYTPTGRDYTRQTPEGNFIVMTADKKERVFRVRTLAGDLRTQVAIFATDEPTARSIAAQFCLFIDDFGNRRFWANYKFAGVNNKYPVQLETSDAPAALISNDTHNMTILAIDITLKCTVPLFYAPQEREPNDGKGIPRTLDPAGYPYTQRVEWKDKYQDDDFIHSVELDENNQSKETAQNEGG